VEKRQKGNVKIGGGTPEERGVWSRGENGEGARESRKKNIEEIKRARRRRGTKVCVHRSSGQRLPCKGIQRGESGT